MLKMMTRKEFLTKGLTIVAAGATAPMFLTRTALALQNPWDQALTASAAGSSDGPILGVVQMGGGNDGLNTVGPFVQDGYYRARPRLAVPRERVLRVTDELGFHPGLAPLKALYDDGQLAVVQGVGYPNPNRSHFRSMEIWHTADPSGAGPRTGWLGRLFDSECPSCGPTAGIALTGAEMPLAMQGASGKAGGVEGFDTHAAGAGRHDRLLEDFGAGLAAFVKDLTRKGLLGRVLVMTFSEFGRRVAENASGGTDHGAAAPMIVIGSQVAPGVH